MNEPLLHILVCGNRREQGELPSCGQSGAEDLLAEFRNSVDRLGMTTKVKVTATGCLTPCDHGVNVVVYPNGIWYCHVQIGDVTEILQTHLSNKAPIERLRLPTSVRLL